MKHARNTAVAELPAEQKAALQAEATRSIKAKSDKKRKEERKQLLDNAWGSRRAWCRAEYLPSDSPGLNIASSFLTLTNAAHQHGIPLESFYTPGGLLHTLAHTQDPPPCHTRYWPQAYRNSSAACLLLLLPRRHMTTTLRSKGKNPSLRLMTASHTT
ncbi:hypothetical protein ColLi_13262 [Colletotrichum liriopes]|uniref:Uncharacterized protein n=1 Tax=Colletotrichum liriopes TaxID=708192 RepID=A0AA37H0S4_9PEZI|nr:hypothetical protein ColLi_13262 [Colletotrichum liriopes]